MSYLLLVLSFALLLLGAVVFTNAVEWVGHHLGLGAGAVGSILAAVATALPESIIPVVAIIAGQKTGGIAIGAILGAPFLLGTLALGLVGIAAFGFRSRRDQGRRLELHRQTTSRDLVFFLAFFGAAMVLGVVGGRVVNVVAAVVLVAAYVTYVVRSVRRGGEVQAEEELKALYLDWTKDDPPHVWQAVVQLLAGLAAIIGGAHLFVTVIEQLAHQFGVPALVLALVLAPLATELPEKANSFLWTRRGKDALAVGNITGAMVFQSMVPVAVGMAFTPWQLRGPALAAGGCALVGGVIALVVVRRSDRFGPLAVTTWLLLYLGCVAGIIVTMF